MLALYNRTRHRSLPQRRVLIAALLVSVTLPPLAAIAQSLEPPPSLLMIATRVQDGDSFIARSTDGHTVPIRIAGIDAPERTQPWAEASRRRLRELIDHRVLQIMPLKRDVYGRSVARVLLADGPLAGQDVGLLMVGSGHAWHFTRYAGEQPADERQAYRQAERIARERRSGLWQDPRPTPPWEFRSRQRGSRKTAPQTIPAQP